MSEVVVIGSGFGGLCTAYILKKNGYDVTVLEKEAQVGGCLQCFRRDGVKFETGMHFIGSAAPGQTIDRLFHFLEISDDVPLRSLDKNAYNTIVLSGEKFTFANGREAFYENLSLRFPKEKDALRKYLNIIDDIAVASSLGSLTSPDRDVAANSEYHTRSINDVLDSLFRDEMLKNVLVGDIPLYDGRRDRTPFSLHAFIMDFYNRSAFRVAGGSDSIAKSLYRKLAAMGTKVFLRRKAAEIVCNDVKAVGVRTEEGDFFPADYIISTVHPKRTLEMLDTPLIRPAFRSRISSIPQTASPFTLYVKFKDGMVPYLNTNSFEYSGITPWDSANYIESKWPESFLYMHICPERDNGSARAAQVLTYMNFNEVSKWLGTSPGRRGEEYEEFKLRHAEKLIDAVDRSHKGFKDALESFYTSTPLTYFDYTGTEDGSMYGVTRDITLGVAGHVPYRTKIPNLLLSGQNVNSHGIMGVMVGAILTCSALVDAAALYRQIFEKDR